MKPYPEAPSGLVVEHDGPVLRLRLDRPDRRNAITDPIVYGLIDTIDATDNINVRLYGCTAVLQGFTQAPTPAVHQRRSHVVRSHAVRAHGFPALGDMTGATVHLAGSGAADSACADGAALVQ